MIELPWNGPISEVTMAKYVEALELRAEQRVLDVGCGCGEVLIRLCERFRIRGTGIDSSTEHIAEAKRRAEGRVPDSAVRFVEANAQSFHVDPDSLDLAVCMGASHAFGLGSTAYPNAIEQLIPLVVPGGLLLIAEGYMRQPAAAEYRKLLGESMPDEMTHAFNVSTGQQLGLIPLAAWASSEEEWDDFEWSYQRIVERKAEERPSNRDLQVKLQQRREWMDAYLQWGRDTLGYGVYLFKKPKR
jgi:cyclopropane fatty-acyl-phospholipid synthase-like methyltransferase